MGRLFGTDGARGIANTELTCELAMQIGRAAACVLTEATHHRPLFLIGMDTRVSSEMLEAAMVAGLTSVGADVKLLGVIPTPAVAYLVKKYGADAGIMISASHNPCEYNGIKLFNGEGFKLSDQIEEQIEAIVLDRKTQLPSPVGGDLGRVSRADCAVDDYIHHIASTVPCSLSGLKVALDCANGSASVTAKKLFTSLGADVITIHDEPNGININDHCGSTHMDDLIETVKRYRCQAGLAFDGDADRWLAGDEQGNLVDGDRLIAIFADEMMKEGTLKNDTAVVTVMTNLGFFRFCESRGIKTCATKVGDRYVLEEMLKNGYKIGGEQSGHIIFLDHSTTGDGQLTGAQLLYVLRKHSERLSKLSSLMERFPQVLVNVRTDAKGKAKFPEDTVIKERIDEACKQLGRDGRVLVRISGTEHLIRVMVEGKDFDTINRIAVDLSDVIKERLQ